MVLIVLVAEIMISRLDGLATQYGFAVSYSYRHHSPRGTIAGINGFNRGFGGDIPTGWANSN
jgi:hypothetical protein